MRNPGVVTCTPSMRVSSFVGRATVLLLAATLACDGISQPEDNFTIVLTASDWPMRLETASDGWPIASCAVFFMAAGEGRGSAHWGEARLRWFAGLDRSVAVDSFVVPARTMHDMWGSDVITAGQGPEFGWMISAAYPFEVEAEFHYVRDGDGGPGMASVRRACGPRPQVPAPAPPVVDAVSIAPAGSRQPGDTVAVDYSVSTTNSFGLWASVVVHWDAFDSVVTVSEFPRTASARATRTRIPAASTIGRPARVSVLAVDVFGQIAEVTRDAGMLSDGIAPSVTLRARVGPVGPLSSVLAGTWFTGDTLELEASTTDNHSITSVTWETSAGQRDSVRVSGPAALVRAKVGARPEWGSGFQLRLSVRDSAGNQASGVVGASPGFRVQPSFRRPLSSLVLSGGKAVAIALDEPRGLAYVLLSDGCCTSSIQVVSMATLTVTQTIPITGLVATGMDITPSRDTLLVPIPSRNALAVIALRGSAAPVFQRITVFRDSIGEMPGLVTVAANGKVFVTQYRPEGKPLAELDAGTGVQRLRNDATHDDSVVALLKSLNGASLTIVRKRCVQRYDTATDIFGPCTPLVAPGIPASDLTGARHVVGLDVYDGGFTFLRRMASVERPFEGTSLPVLTAAGEHVYHYREFAGLLRSRVSDGDVVDRTMDARWPYLARMWSDDSRLLMVSNEDIGTIRLTSIDMREASAIPVEPAALAVTFPSQHGMALPESARTTRPGRLPRVRALGGGTVRDWAGGSRRR